MKLNPQNLIPLNQRSKEEQRVIQANGGYKSGQSRRKRKALAEAFDVFLSMKIKDQKMISQLNKLGVKGKDLTYQSAIVMAMIIKASNGNVKAFEAIRDTLGESIQNINLTADSASVMDEFIAKLEGRRNNLIDEPNSD